MFQFSPLLLLIFTYCQVENALGDDGNYYDEILPNRPFVPNAPDINSSYTPPAYTPSRYAVRMRELVPLRLSFSHQTYIVPEPNEEYLKSILIVPIILIAVMLLYILFIACVLPIFRIIHRRSERSQKGKGMNQPSEPIGNARNININSRDDGSNAFAIGNVTSREYIENIQQRRARILALIGFVMSILLSIIFLALSLAANSYFYEKTNDLLEVADDLSSFLYNGSFYLNYVNNKIDVFNSYQIRFSQECAMGYTSQQSAEVSANLDGIKNQVNSLQNTLNDVSDNLNSFKDIGYKFNEARTTISLITISILIVLTAIFGITVAAHQLDHNSRKNEKCKRILFCLLTSPSIILVMIIVIIFWIVAAVQQALAVVASDMCTPDVDVILTRVAAEVLGYNDYAKSVSYICEPEDTAMPPLLQVICYYQTCQANVTDMGQAISTGVSSYMNIISALDNAEAELFKLAESDTKYICLQSVSGLLLVVLFFFVTFAWLFYLVSCPNINPLYLRAIHQGVCDNLMEAIFKSWVYMVIACVFLMVAILIYKLNYFGTYNEADEETICCCNCRKNKGYETLRDPRGSTFAHHPEADVTKFESKKSHSDESVHSDRKENTTPEKIEEESEVKQDKNSANTVALV